jgi:hypothetical protein
MRKIVIAALAATMLAGPATAAEWWQEGYDRQTERHTCFKDYSPAREYEDLKSLHASLD